MKKQNSETKNAVPCFEVAYETLGQGAQCSSQLETRKLNLDVDFGSKPTVNRNVNPSFSTDVVHINKIRKILNRIEEILGISEDDEPFQGFHEGTM
jgi:hypothetical protein